MQRLGAPRLRDPGLISTLLMLVSALLGRRRMLELYAEAIEARMRFYSYGDASLLWRPGARRDDGA